MSTKFPAPIVEELNIAKSLGVRSGSEHRYTAIWVVVVDGRVFVRSWNDKPTGWFRAFKKNSIGKIQFGKQELSVRSKVVRSERIREAVTAAFGRKYNTKGSKQWVDGFAEPQRRVNTLEFVPTD